MFRRLTHPLFLVLLLALANGGWAAENPHPANGATDVSLDVLLSWSSMWALQYDVYFGTDMAAVAEAHRLSPEYEGRQTAETYNPAFLLPQTTYYWRIDDVGGELVFPGVVWSFTTESVPFAMATNPNPHNHATGVPPDAIVSWSPAPGAAAHDVYFGTDAEAVSNASKSSPEYRGRQDAELNAYDPGSLQPNRSYYWRIDSVFDLGVYYIVYVGFTWDFTTGRASEGELTPDCGAVIVEQIDFRDAPDSRIGELTVVRSLANIVADLTSGYVNAMNGDGEWVVRNLPVLSDFSYDLPTIATRFDLNVPNGTNVSEMELYVEYTAEPCETFLGGPARPFVVTPTMFAAGGVGDLPLSGYTAAPDLSTVTFELGGLISHSHQIGHENEQAACNQCAPMAVANSLHWLRTWQGLEVDPNHEHKPGLRSDAPADGDDPNDPSLVGELERAMDRGVRSRTDGDGVWPMDGKLKYISENDLDDKLVIKHQGNGDTGGNPNEEVDGSEDITRHGVTSHGKGDEVTWEWLCQEIRAGEDVEVDIVYFNEDGTEDGRHYVNVIGCGEILGFPYILHVSDHAQTDEDPNDEEGTDKVDFEWMFGDRVLNSNGRLDQAISESIKPPPVLIIASFESFTATGELITDTWIDGATTGTGARVSLATDVAHTGEKSMALDYDHASPDVPYSETHRTWPVPQDWTTGELTALSLWFQGDPCNIGDKMYVGLEDSTGMSATVPHDNPDAVLLEGWQPWTIPLARFASEGVDLSSISKVSIGIGGEIVSGPVSGRVYIDDIALCVPTCVPEYAPPGDVNFDCVVDFADVATVAMYWLESAPFVCAECTEEKKCRFKVTKVTPQNEGSCPVWLLVGHKCIHGACVDKDDCDEKLRFRFHVNEYDCLIDFEPMDCAKTAITQPCNAYQTDL